MARGDKARSISGAKEEARTTQRKLQEAGVSKRSAERIAWDKIHRNGLAKRASGTASGRSKVSKRTTLPKGSTRKAKTIGKTRR
jgi:hypothetical protein